MATDDERPPTQDDVWDMLRERGKWAPKPKSPATRRVPATPAKKKAEQRVQNPWPAVGLILAFFGLLKLGDCGLQCGPASRPIMPHRLPAAPREPVVQWRARPPFEERDGDAYVPTSERRRNLPEATYSPAVTCALPAQYCRPPLSPLGDARPAYCTTGGPVEKCAAPGQVVRAHVHQGGDYPAPTGTRIGAVRAGVVSQVSRNRTGSGGLIVKICHDNGCSTFSRYLHLDRIDVHVGQALQANDQVGTVGSTGTSSTGAHLHLEYWVNGHPTETTPLMVQQ